MTFPLGSEHVPGVNFRIYLPVKLLTGSYVFFSDFAFINFILLPLLLPFCHLLSCTVFTGVV